MNLIRLITIISIIFSTSVLAKKLKVTYDNEVQVQIGSQLYHLNAGDIIEINNQEGAKQHIKVVKTSLPQLKNKKAIIWSKTFNDLVSNDSLTPNSSIFQGETVTLLKRISIGNSSGGATLEPGDVIRVKESANGKQNIEVVESTTAPKGNAIIWKKTYDKYMDSGDVFSDQTGDTRTGEQIREDQAELDAIIAKLMSRVTNESDEDVDQTIEPVEAPVEEVKCPSNNTSLKLLKGIYIAVDGDKKNYLPAGTKVKTVKNDDGRCGLSILAFPKGSGLSKDDFPKIAKTSPLNLPTSNIEEIEFDDESLELKKGLVFNLQKGQDLGAIGRRTGKRYVMNSNDKIEIVGRHKNGSYIVKRNGKKWEYRINASELEQLNDIGLLSPSTLDSVAAISNDDLFNQTVEESTPEEPDCIDEPAVSKNIGDFNWQTCRKKSVKSKKGKVYKPNNYMENKIPLTNAKANKLLADAETANFAMCISSSLKKGLNRNTNPSCKRDANGKLKAERVRQAIYKKKNGKKKFSYWKLLRRAPRACASKKLSTHLAHRFVKAAKCVGVDPKEVFPIINHESHFQPGAVSPTFALGVGQIVPTNYLAFYNSLISAKRFIKNKPKLHEKMQSLKTQKGYAAFENLPGKKKALSRYPAFFATELNDQMTKRDNPNCKEFYQLVDNPFTIPRWAKETESKLHGYLRSREHERLCEPKNPSEGFLISMIYYKMNKKYAKHLLTSNNLGLSKKQTEEFSIILSRWMYNGGSAGAINRFKVLIDLIKENRLPALNSKGQRVYEGGKKKIRKNVKLSSFTNKELKRYMKFLLKEYYPSKSKTRRKEVANYVPGNENNEGGIDGDLKMTEEKGTLKCGNAY